MQLNVPFSEIPEQGIEYDVRDSSWFPAEFGEPIGTVAVHVRLTKKSENRIELRGHLQAGITLACDRCLEKFVFQVDTPMQLVVEVEEKEERWRLQDLEPTEAELETVSQDKPVVDLAELLRQQLYLAVPEKRLCREICPGLCQQCGANLNAGDCGCVSHAGSSPFTVLEKLKKN